MGTMRVTKSWLAEFAPFDLDASEIAATLDDLGMVVEGVDEVGAGLGDDVIVARVLEIAGVPNADRVRKVTVDIGGDVVDVVCGAWNFAAGDLVAMAKVGAELPGDVKIGRRKIKGVASEGMLCSGVELGLSADASGILVLGSGAGGTEVAPGTAVLDALGIRADVVFDLAIEANRPDAMCVAGVARDLAARLKLPFFLPDHKLDDHQVVTRASTNDAGPVSVTDDALVSLVLEDTLNCPRFSATCITGVKVGQSPAWVASRLVLAGMRPINSIVDASNYVMLELGQPTHPYDLDSLAGGIVVRSSRDGDTLETLDGVERNLSSEEPAAVEGAGQSPVGGGDCLICDAEGKPVAIGGIMGGTSTQITPATTRLLLEAAYFLPLAIARTSKRLGLRTEASMRFERGCDPEGIDRAVARLCSLILETSEAGKPSIVSSLDARGKAPSTHRARLRLGRINAILGTRLAPGDVETHLGPMGFVLRADAGVGVGETQRVWDVDVPTWRPDVEREIDLIEEVARQHGYSRIPRTRRLGTRIGVLSPHQRTRRLVREVMVGLASCEAWTPTMVSARDHAVIGLPGGVELANPLNREELVLRRSLLPGLLRSCYLNHSRRRDEVLLFEIGRIFDGPADSSGTDDLSAAPYLPVVASGWSQEVPREREVLGALFAAGSDGILEAVQAWHVLAGALGLARFEDGLDPCVEIVAGSSPGLHPGRSAWIVAGQLRPGAASGASSVETGPEARLGCVGEVSRSAREAFGLGAHKGTIGWLEVDLARLCDAPKRSRIARAASKFPSNDVDLAFAVEDTVPASVVEAVLSRAGGELLESVQLFDVFRGGSLGDGQRSLAYRLRFCALERTMSDAEVGELRAACISAVQRALPAKLRGN